MRPFGDVDVDLVAAAAAPVRPFGEVEELLTASILA